MRLDTWLLLTPRSFETGLDGFICTPKSEHLWVVDCSNTIKSEVLCKGRLSLGYPRGLNLICYIENLSVTSPLEA